MRARGDAKKKPPAADTRPRPWMRGAGVNWVPRGYTFGEGLRLMTGDRLFELVPYVVAPGGVVAGYAVEIDGARNGFIRTPGAIEQAQAVVELMLTEEAVRKGR